MYLIHSDLPYNSCPNIRSAASYAPHSRCSYVVPVFLSVFKYRPLAVSLTHPVIGKNAA